MVLPYFYLMKKISFTTTLHKFGSNGEKTGWTYIEIPADLAQDLKPDHKKSFRVKGSIDAHKITGVALLPMGNGSFIMAVNADMRKGIRKKEGAMVGVQLQVDEKGYELNKDFMDCLRDDPQAYDFFKTLAPGHQNYFSKWIDSAKTEVTKIKRIAMAVEGLSRKMEYNVMIRFHKGKL